MRFSSVLVSPFYSPCKYKYIQAGLTLDLLKSKFLNKPEMLPDAIHPLTNHIIIPFPLFQKTLLEEYKELTVENFSGNGNT